MIEREVALEILTESESGQDLQQKSAYQDGETCEEENGADTEQIGVDSEDEFISMGQSWNCSDVQENEEATEDEEKQSFWGSNKEIMDRQVSDEKEQESVLDDIREKRDLMDFLRMSRKHDVWKEIKATKAEIRRLEMEIKERKRLGDRSL